MHRGDLLPLHSRKRATARELEKNGATAQAFCAITSSEEFVCWGKNNVGLLGTGTKIPYNATPTQVFGLTNLRGQLGDGTI